MHQTLQQHIADPVTICLDLRPHGHHCSAFLSGALHLLSTLPKQPLFLLHKLAALIANASSRSTCSEWRQAKVTIVYRSRHTCYYERK